MIRNPLHGNYLQLVSCIQGLPQFIQLVFPKHVSPTRLIMTFQGGFVGTQCIVEVAASSDQPVWTTLTHIHPEDVNRRQFFELPEAVPNGIQCLKFLFNRSSDFFGRITLYELQVEGSILHC